MPVMEAGNLGSPGNGAIETWVNLGANGAQFTLLNAVVNRGDGSMQDKMILGAHAPKGNIAFGFDIGGSWAWAESQIYPQDLIGAWHHLAGTWGSRGLELWLDGKLCSRYDYFDRIYYPIYRYRVGCDAGGHCAQGTFDEIRLSSVQRTFTRLGDLLNIASGAHRDTSPLPLFLPFLSLPATPTRIPCSPI